MKGNSAPRTTGVKGPAIRPPDAGMRHIDHYAHRLPQWRYALRQALIPIVRVETPYLALLQEKCRNPFLDSYFAFTANLGTHTFFMTALPILFWCGYTEFGRATCHMLAAGVIWSGFLKDLLCLPRPLSPPLQRITMSGSAALEYGWPSTHSTNAVSVAVYCLWHLYGIEQPANPGLHQCLKFSLYWYAISIVLGRLYCGMHGFFDVIIGSLLGAVIALIQISCGTFFDNLVMAESSYGLLAVMLLILVLVRVHPEPADDCPCFDDSVAFAGVTLGLQVGAWHYARSGLAWDHPVPSTAPFDMEKIGWVRTFVRIVTGVVIIFMWRALMKPFMLRILPPFFRFIDQLGLILPRKFFLPSSQYTIVPPLRHDDHVIPSASEIPGLLARRRAVSVGPQSAADAYETIAYRQKRRRESLENLSNQGSQPNSPTTPSTNKTVLGKGQEVQRRHGENDLVVDTVVPGTNLLPTPLASRVHSYERMMGSSLSEEDENIPSTPITPTTEPDYNQAELEPFPDFEPEKFKGPEDGFMDEEEDRKIFLQLKRPRVRYDVEVVTKLIVYTGIAWLAVEGNPRFFDAVGLGLTGTV